ncbi:MAG: M20 family metallo-hydrolase [Verrucomicrobiota bacterium]
MGVDSVIEKLNRLGTISDEPKRLTRTFLSPAHREAAQLILSWMEALGMETSHTVDGTLRGVLPGSNPEAQPWLLGSHYDTVIDAGKYDGPLGIVAALEALSHVGSDLPFPVHVLAFSDEEGARFHTTYLGSRSVLGPLDKGTLSICDERGVCLGNALEKEGWHEDATPICYQPGSVRGYLELHIEQGRVLESRNQSACAVSSIAGQTRLAVTMKGQADHAGTTPMNLRRDALAGAAECILAAESLARRCEGAVITVGKLSVQPGASNSVPDFAEFTVDLRHAEDETRNQLTDLLHREMREVAESRGLELGWCLVQHSSATSCDSELTNQLVESVDAVTGCRDTLVSGAGHDGVALASIMPIAMLFVRSRAGISHHPAEYTSPEDIQKGIEILTHFLTNQSA